MGSLNATVYCKSWSDSICHSLYINPRYCNWQKRPTNDNRASLGLVWGTRLQLFHQLFPTYRLSYLSQRFRTFIDQSKDIIPPLYCPVFVHPGPPESLTLFSFFDRGVFRVILLYMQASQSSPHTFFSQHWFNCTVMFGEVNLLSPKQVIDEIVFALGKRGCI